MNGRSAAASPTSPASSIQQQQNRRIVHPTEHTSFGKVTPAQRELHRGVFQRSPPPPDSESLAHIPSSPSSNPSNIIPSSPPSLNSRSTISTHMMAQHVPRPTPGNFWNRSPAKRLGFDNVHQSNRLAAPCSRPSIPSMGVFFYSRVCL
jgi:hypothetical protein